LSTCVGQRCALRSRHWRRRARSPRALLAAAAESEEKPTAAAATAAATAAAAAETRSSGSPSVSGLSPIELPRHVAVIMDGNARWAEQHSLPQMQGHERGVESLRRTLRCCLAWGVEALTVYAFSMENWRREEGEVSYLLALLERSLAAELPELQRQGVRVCIAGDTRRLSPGLKNLIVRAVEETATNTRATLTVALSYSAREDIVDAAKSIARRVRAGELDPEEVDEAAFSAHLSTEAPFAEVGDPDLLIRTSGEMRLSNFLLWELAYTELYFTETLWPDFDEAEFRRALQCYASRHRRFGRRERGSL